MLKGSARVALRSTSGKRFGDELLLFNRQRQTLKECDDACFRGTSLEESDMLDR